MKKYYKLLFFTISGVIVIALMFTSCKKFVTIPPAPNEIVSSNVFADSTDSQSAVEALYYSMASSTALLSNTGGLTAYTGLSSDELSAVSQNNANLNIVYANALLSTNDNSISPFWTSDYALIYEANAIIEGLSTSTSVSNSAKNQFIGEAKVVRALTYFNLENLYGSVPMILTTNYQVNATLPRTSTNGVYQQIINDLVSAQNLLTPAYPSAGRARINMYSATALLARVYLFQSQWANAEASATQIINSGLYSLVPNLNNVFLAGSNEAIWQIQPYQPGYPTSEGYAFIPSTTTVIPKWVVSNGLLNTFESGDQRKIDWLNSNVIKGTTYYYPYKYKLAGNKNTSPPAEDEMMFRLAEQYLIRAEARAELGESNADNDLNIVRNRAGLPNYSGATDQVSLLTAIHHEMQIEFFCEQGHRWFDLKRTGLVNTVMSLVTPTKGGTWNPDWALYPIDYSQIQANPFLTQNPGY